MFEKSTSITSHTNSEIKAMWQEHICVISVTANNYSKTHQV